MTSNVFLSLAPLTTQQHAPHRDQVALGSPTGYSPLEMLSSAPGKLFTPQDTCKCLLLLCEAILDFPPKGTCCTTWFKGWAVPYSLPLLGCMTWEE